MRVVFSHGRKGKGMECMVFGLPFMTVAVVTVVPLIFAAILVWWGITYRPSGDKEKRAGDGRKS